MGTGGRPGLVLPDAGYQRSFLAAMAEDRGYAATAGLDLAHLLAPAAFARYVAALRADVEEASPRPTLFVPQTVLWWVRDGEVLGRVGIRHRLNHRLRTFGGHIGYWVRPSARRQGHAGAAFRAGLAVAHGLGIDPALLTCDHDNEASRRVIEGAGGRFEQVLGAKRLYWVPTRPRVPAAGPPGSGSAAVPV